MAKFISSERKFGGSSKRKSSRSGGSRSGSGSGSGSGSDLTVNSSPDDMGEVQSSDGEGGNGVTGGGRGTLIVEEEEAEESDGVESFVFHYFAIFDGHAGTGAAIFAANSLHHHIKVIF